MKLNKIALALVAATATVASAGVTVTPLVGYQYQDKAHDKQREIFKTRQQLNDANAKAPNNPANGGVALESDLYTGLALGVELTPSTQFQVEYGVTDTDARASKASANAHPRNVFDAKEEIISGNFLIGTEQFSGYTNNKFKPYVLIGQVKPNIK